MKLGLSLAGKIVSRLKPTKKLGAAIRNAVGEFLLDTERVATRKQAEEIRRILEGIARESRFRPRGRR